MTDAEKFWRNTTDIVLNAIYELPEQAFELFNFGKAEVEKLKSQRIDFEPVNDTQSVAVSKSKKHDGFVFLYNSNFNPKNLQPVALEFLADVAHEIAHMLQHNNTNHFINDPQCDQDKMWHNDLWVRHTMTSGIAMAGLSALYAGFVSNQLDLGLVCTNILSVGLGCAISSFMNYNFMQNYRKMEQEACNFSTLMIGVDEAIVPENIGVFGDYKKTAHDYIYQAIAQLPLPSDAAYKIGWHEHPSTDERSKGAQEILDFMVANNIQAPLQPKTAQKLTL